MWIRSPETSILDLPLEKEQTMSPIHNNNLKLLKNLQMHSNRQLKNSK